MAPEPVTPVRSDSVNVFQRFWISSFQHPSLLIFMLGHKSLETTMRYFGITNLDSLTDKIDTAAAVAVADVGD